jgi:uncharacterized protein YbjT (DUF2867 family)
MPVRRVIILGANGRIGHALFRRLRMKTGSEVIGTSRRKDVQEGMQCFDPFTDSWPELGEADVLINCIGAIQEKAKYSLAKVHIDLAGMMIRNREAIGNPAILQISALGAAEDHPSGFLRTKGQADALLLEQENTWIIRPSIVCVPGTALAGKLRMLRKIAAVMNGHLLLPKDFINSYIQPILMEDLEELIERIMTQGYPERIIHAAGPEKINYDYLLSLPGKDLKQLIRVKEINEHIFRAIVRFFISPLFPGLLSYEQYRLLFDDNTTDIAAVKSILGREPGSTIGFWRNNGEA